MMQVIKNRLKHVQRDFLVTNAKKRIREKEGLKLFIDCGANLGQGYSYFSKIFDPNTYDYVLFEPNPNCYDKLVAQNYKGNIEIFNQGVWTHNSTLKLYGLSESNDNFSQGASIISDHNSIYYEANDDSALEVDVIDLNEFIKNKTHNYVEVILKLDVESAEYEILNSLIESRMIEKIDVLFVEFHSKYFKGKEKEKKIEEKTLVRKIRSMGVHVVKWNY